MKFSVKVGERIYKVEIEDLKTRPVIAIVDGIRFEVHPEEEKTTSAAMASQITSETPTPAAAPVPATGAVPSGGMLNTNSVRAPIPGVILDVSVKPGQTVEFGQPLFVIEAMKMRNTIRASRAGMVGSVLVTTGQTVNHNQELMTFAENGICPSTI